MRKNHCCGWHSADDVVIDLVQPTNSSNNSSGSDSETTEILPCACCPKHRECDIPVSEKAQLHMTIRFLKDTVNFCNKETPGFLNVTCKHQFSVMYQQQIPHTQYLIYASIFVCFLSIYCAVMLAYNIHDGG